ncbi:MAG TPA: MBL fold metallo-hydrolase [Actinomycetota bacterium]
MEPVVFEVAEGITAIDTFFAGRERYTAAYLLSASEPAIVETGPTTSQDAVVAGLARLGIGPQDLAHVVVTHIHLDHAGGVGRIASTFPAATVWVHEAGAPHLADPTRLIASAARIYGDRMPTLFGPVDPVPPPRIRSLAGEDEVPLGDRTLRAVYAPGHAKHQVALIDSATGAVFTGDAIGIHPPDVPVLRPATPPPEFDLELAIDTIERIRRLAGEMLLFAHFGPVREVDRICDLAVARYRRWTEAVREALERTDDLDEIAAVLQQVAEGDLQTGSEAQLDLNQLETLSSVRMNAMGIIRYWNKRAERDAAEGGSDDAPPRAGDAQLS